MSNGSRNKFVDGRRKDARPCGKCHYPVHKGLLTVKQMKEHECKKKHCHWFEVYSDHPYWVRLEKERKERCEKRKRYEH